VTCQAPASRVEECCSAAPSAAAAKGDAVAVVGFGDRLGILAVNSFDIVASGFEGTGGQDGLSGLQTPSTMRPAERE
jgi:N-methylhydantoinase B/oxoprolinase/acetone carboxylase alpha subunit